MSMSRKDSKGRVLRKGESQRKNDGRYIYQYTDSTGKRRVVYSNDLLELREKEKELVRNQLDGLESYCSGKTTLNYAFDRYISTKYDLKEHTRVNYKYMYNRFVRDTFGKRIINDIKYSDVKFFYCSLMNILGLQANTLDNIHTILHPTFQMAVRDNVIRNNPASGVMAEIKKANGKNSTSNRNTDGRPRCCRSASATNGKGHTDHRRVPFRLYPTSFFSYCPLSPHADTIPGMPPSPAPSSFWTDETAYLYPPGSPA